MNEQLQYFVGIDWGTENHRIVLLNQEGRAIEQYDAGHSGKDLASLVDRLSSTCQSPPRQLGIAIEVAWGAVVDTLMENDFSVFSISPKQVDRFRDRYTVAGAKDDSRDALVLASALRTDRKSFKRVEVDDPAPIRLRELSRLDEELKNELHRATNQLWEQLHRYFPQMLKLSSGADDLFVWDLLSKAPTPSKAAKLTPTRVGQILARHRISRFTSQQVLAILREPSLRLTPGAAEAASEHMLLLPPRVALLDQQIRDVQRRTARLLKELPGNMEPNGSYCKHRDVDLLLSLPGVGPVIASTILAEASRPIRERDYQALRCYAGTAPITIQSAKRRTVSMRYACSTRIRQAVFYWSGRSLMFESRSRQHYDHTGTFRPIQKIAHGQHYNRARQRDANQPDYYTEYEVAEQVGTELPSSAKPMRSPFGEVPPCALISCPEVAEWSPSCPFPANLRMADRTDSVSATMWIARHS